MMLLWKGSELTLVDVGAGHLYVDGESFLLSRTILSGTITFASAAIVVERLPKPTMPVAIDTTGTDLVSKNSS
jgi:hypothetical protein